MKHYFGYRDNSGLRVLVVEYRPGMKSRESIPVKFLTPSTILEGLSSNFEIGYIGADPASLAAAILEDCLEPHDVAGSFLLFQDQVISRIDQTPFLLEASAVRAWVGMRKAEVVRSEVLVACYGIREKS